MGLLVRSRWGLFLRAIREDEQAAAASGVAVARFRILAFAIASGFAGLAGGFYGHYIGIMTPGVGSTRPDGRWWSMAVIGGMERLPRRSAARSGWSCSLEALRSYGQWRLPLFGALLLLTMRFARNGLVTPLWLQFVRLGEARVGPLARRPRPAAEGFRRVSESVELVRGVGLVKRFGGIVANDAVDLVVARGRPRRPDRPERLRQDHADQRADRAPRARRRRGAGARPAGERPAASTSTPAWAWPARSS